MLEAAAGAARDRSPARSRTCAARASRSPTSSCARACPSGVAVTLRGERAYEFLDRLMSVAIPRIRDFRGLPAQARRPRQLHDRRPRADHLPRDRLRRGRPGPRPRHHDHDDAPRPTRRATPCSRCSACRSPDSRRASSVERSRWPRRPCASSRRAHPSTRPAATRRCRRCGRSRAVYRKFGICRICLRELAHNGPHPRHDEEQLVDPMSMTDPIADFLTRVRNGDHGAARRGRRSRRPKLKREMARILQEQGYITGFDVEPPNEEHPGELLRVRLKYAEDRSSAISGLKRVVAPRPALLRRTTAASPRSRAAWAPRSCPRRRGVMTGHEARAAGVGGEVVAYVW